MSVHDRVEQADYRYSGHDADSDGHSEAQGNRRRAGYAQDDYPALRKLRWFLPRSAPLLSVTSRDVHNDSLSANGWELGTDTNPYLHEGSLFAFR